MMKIISGGVTAPKGFEAAGIEAGIKYENRKDMALIYSTLPCIAAGTFTSNIVKAAPVKWDKKLIEESPYIQAVVVNTGIANAGTGKDGMACTEETAKTAAEVLGLPTEAVLVGSTGVIGPLLPMDRIKAGIGKLVAAKAATPQAGADAARPAVLFQFRNRSQASIPAGQRSSLRMRSIKATRLKGVII